MAAIFILFIWAKIWDTVKNISGSQVWVLFWVLHVLQKDFKGPFPFEVAQGTHNGVMQKIMITSAVRIYDLLSIL